MKYYYPNMPNRIETNSSLFKQLDNDDNWIAEQKKNGWRCLVMRNDKVELWTRHHTIITEPLLKIRTELEQLPKNTILDGEIIHFRTKEYKEQLYLFDVIQIDGKLVINLPLVDRKNILLSIINESQNIEISKMYYKNKIDLFYNSISNELLEGIVMKKLDSKYLISETKCLTNPYWIKVKK